MGRGERREQPTTGPVTGNDPDCPSGPVTTRAAAAVSGPHP